MYLAAALLTPVGLTWLATAPLAAAAGPCRVELRPGDAPRPWVAAATALRASLRGGGAAADHDCREVVIYASLERPSVEVTTLDGRHGVRRLNDARDVDATVAALIVTVRAGADRAASDDGAPTITAHVVPVASGARAANAAGWRPQIAVGGAARVSLPSTSAPLLELNLGIARASWEASLFGAWAPTTIGLGAQDASFASSSEIGLGGAWRQALGALGVDLILGARGGVIRFVEDPNQQGEHEDIAGVAPALTAFAGAAIGTGSIVRFRPQLWYQWAAATRLGGPNASARLSSVGLSIGVESRLP